MQRMQENRLFIFDPKAMHHVIVKVGIVSGDHFYRPHCQSKFQDQPIYEEPQFVIEYQTFFFR